MQRKLRRKLPYAKYFGTIQMQNKIYFYDLQMVKRIVAEGMLPHEKYRTLPPPHGPGCGGGGGQVTFCQCR